MTTSTASAVWEGGLRNGKGKFSAGSGAFGGDYTFATRFESAKGTNPEELIAAAHAACLSMALSAGLEAAKTPATSISTKASCTVEKVGDGFGLESGRPPRPTPDHRAGGVGRIDARARWQVGEHRHQQPTVQRRRRRIERIGKRRIGFSVRSAVTDQAGPRR